MNSAKKICGISNQKIEISEVLYLLYFGVMFGARAIGLFEGMTVYNISLVIGMLLFAVKVAMTEHTVLEYCLAGFLLLVSVVVYYNTGEKGLLLYFTMMLGMKGVSTKRVFKLGSIILSVSFTSLVLLSITGLKEEIIYINDRAGFGKVIRHSLGYPYPNTLFTTYIVLMILIFYVLEKQNKKNLLLTTLFLLMGSVYIFIYSCSNTGLIVSVFYLLVNLYLQCRRKLSRFEKIGIQLMYPLCLIFAIAGPLVTRGKLFQLLDKVLHNRWAYSLYYLTNEPITLFGVRFKEAPDTNYMIDSSFLYSFLQLGIIPFVIVTLLFLGMINDYVKREMKTELAIILSFCVLGLSDPFLFNLSYKNLMFLFVGEYLFRKLKLLEEREMPILNHKIRLLAIGKRCIVYDTSFYQKCSNNWNSLRLTISQNSGVLTGIYLLFMGAISGVLFLLTQNKNITGRVDDVAEWEYLRNVISSGVFAGAAIVIVFIFAIRRRKKADDREGIRS